MSLNTIERVFWEFGDEPERVKQFLKDPDAYLAPYPLSDNEREMVRKMDVKALDSYGVSNMLVMLAWTSINGSNPVLMFEYLKQMNDGRMLNRMKLPGWQFGAIRLALGVRNAWLGTMRILGLKKQLG